MNRNRGHATSELHFGQVKVEVKPRDEFKDQYLAIDAMAHAIQTPLVEWAIENTVDPQTKGGKQEQVTLVASDGKRQIADITLSVPTTQNYGKGMFEALAEQTLMPAGVRSFRAYETPGSDQRTSPPQAGQGQLARIASEVIEQTSRVRPQELKRQKR